VNTFTSLINGIELTITNPNQILGMGGPYIGDVKIETDFILKNIVLDNYVVKNDRSSLFFVRYHRINLYHYFTINFYNINSNTAYEFDKEFDMIYIGEFTGENELEIYPAFHDQFKSTRIIFNLDEESFSQLY
jgi:hypothetical protein